MHPGQSVLPGSGRHCWQERRKQLLRCWAGRLDIVLKWFTDGIWTELGTPTINQRFPEGFIQPKFGVYASLCEVGGKFYYGVTNIGVKPTVGSAEALSETWIPEYSGDLYGKHIPVMLLAFLRPERKFENLQALRAEIQKNRVQAEKVARNKGY